MKQPCPICQKPAAERGVAGSPFPFCSDRCRLADLGQWLEESYRIPDWEAALRDDELADG